MTTLEEKIDLFINETQQQEPLFTDKKSAQDVAKELERKIDAPYVSASVSTLSKIPSILMKISLDEKEDWPNNIYENSRHFSIHLDPDPSKSNLEMFTISHKIKTKKMRKQKAKSIKEVIKKINNWISKAE